MSPILKVMIVSIFSFYFQSEILAQNLIPNFSFEEYNDCPINPWQFDGYIKNWEKATINSPTHRVHCGVPSINDVPFSLLSGFQLPQNGNGFVEIVFYTDFQEFSGQNYRQYATVELSEELKRDTSYCLSFHVNLSNLSNYATKDINVLFLDYNIKEDTLTDFLPFSDKLIEIDTFITDTSGWTLIHLDYKAKGGEKHIVFGNFKPNEETSKRKLWNSTSSTWHELSAYNIDNVKLIPRKQFTIGNDSVICTDSYKLLAPTGFQSYFWNTGDTTDFINVTKTGGYAIEAFLGSCSYKDSIYIELVPSIDSLIPETLFYCDNNDSFYYEIIVPNDSIIWNGVKLNNNTVIPAEGMNNVIVFWKNCVIRDSVMVTQIKSPEVLEQIDTIICRNTNSPLLQFTDSLYWYFTESSAIGNLTQPFIPTNRDTVFNFWVNYVRNGCISAKSAVKISIISPPKILLPSDTSICLNNRISINLNPKNLYIWENNDTTNIREIYESGIYRIIGSNLCGIVSDEFELKVVDCQNCIYLPNIITPRSNDENSYLSLLSSCDIHDINVLVFNKWGELIYKSNDKNFRFNGVLKNKKLPAGVYTVSIKYFLEGNFERSYSIIGDVLILY